MKPRTCARRPPSPLPESTRAVGAEVLDHRVSTAPEIEWLDSAFYTLHDEWYWFQLLNGSPVRGFDAAPPTIVGAPFRTVADVYDWAESRPAPLHLDLRFTSLDRLYSQTFYDQAIDAAPDRWLIELEFSDEAPVDQIGTYFDVISDAVPDDIATGLFWVPRSRVQEQVAAEIETSNGPHREQVVRYDELTEVGDVEVYSHAIAAGRLLVVTKPTASFAT
jgi:hypothetical protein